MISKFVYWLTSIVEDDPIPYEILHICIVYTKNNNSNILFLGGTEHKPNQNNIFDYFPLEAQFFYCPELQKIKDIDYYSSLVKNIIDESFSSEYLKKQFENKNIYFGEYGQNLEFLFNVKKI